VNKEIKYLSSLTHTKTKLNKINCNIITPKQDESAISKYADRQSREFRVAKKTSRTPRTSVTSKENNLVQSLQIQPKIKLSKVDLILDDNIDTLTKSNKDDIKKKVKKIDDYYTNVFAKTIKKEFKSEVKIENKRVSLRTS